MPCGAARKVVGIRCAISSNLKLPGQAARSNWLIDGLGGERLPAIDLAHVDLVGGESKPNNIAAVSAEGSTVCVLIRRLNSSCRRSIALVVRTLRHWLGGSRVKVKSRSPASARLSATARCLSREPGRDAALAGSKIMVA
jgi:hypothetical protein